MAVTIPRTPWIDDDGTGTTGTVLNNAIKTELYNQIDTALAGVLPSVGPVTITGGGLTVNGPIHAAGGGLSQGAGAILRINGQNGDQWIFDSGGSLLCQNGGAGGVYLAPGATSWAGVSDARHKTAVVPFTDATQKIRTLTAGTGRYLTDADDCRRSFLIGQQVAAVLPEAVDTAADGTLYLRYTDVIPLLVAAVQELAARVDTR